MFLDLVFNFCCSKRQKDDKDTISQKSNKSQEEQIIQQKKMELNLEKGVTKEIQKSQAQSSIVSPTDNYFQLNDEKQQKKSSFEEDNIDENQLNFQGNEQSKLNHNHVKDHLVKRSKSQEKQEKGLKKKIIKNKEKIDGDKRVVKIWQPEEDQRLRKLYQEYQGNWSKIIQFMPDRNISQCSQRWRRINPIQSKQKWTHDEDTKLISMVTIEGKNWTKLAKNFPGRTGKQIRERYLNKLDPNLNFVAWTEQEDQEIVKYYNQYGAKWSLVAQNLKGRSENMVKNRFYSHIQKHLLGRQNKYQIIYKQGKNQQQQNGISQTFERNQNMDVEYSDTSNNDMKLVHSENYSSSIGSSTFTFSYYDNDEFSGNGEDLNYDNQFDHEFDEKARLY
ncbi:unnamed protein product [Paramecium primaurelia]|uniref:Myb-like DNA-binding domain protein n=1 Tax=Paramecium primaurelia TaxID=5886 RepID=A0A8S1M677_PARPR|nr:unnamed protein product [Paramecium primaurelia]